MNLVSVADVVVGPLDCRRAGSGGGDALTVGHPHTSLGSGASNAEIVASLFMSEATVKAHVSRLLTKLEVTNPVHIAILVHDAQS